MDAFATDLIKWVRESNVQRFKNEEQLTQAVQNRFGGQPGVYPAGCYTGPGGRPGTCDIVMPMVGEGLRWLEVKYVQTYMYQNDPRYNGNFEKYAFGDSHCVHSVRNDLVRKLASLIGHPSVACVGML